MIRWISVRAWTLCWLWLGALARRGGIRQRPSHARGFLSLAAVAVCLSAGAAHAQVDCSATATTGVPQIECEALMALYVSADGTNWADNSNWDTPSAVSTWFGTTVSGGRVTGLSLFTNQLTGPIPPELGNLTNLTDLRLYSNQLSGAIPPELGNLTNLRILNLHLNQLTGAIPPELGNLSNVTDLRVHDNQLSGAIPPELGNLGNLITAYLFNNQLSGPIPPELGNLVNVATLHLGSNQLMGAIPPELGNLSNLIGLYLGSNQVAGPIPAELGNLTSLTTLHLAGNQLSGPIPPELGSLSNLTALYLYGNQLTGSIPSWLGNLGNLTTIYLTNNQLTSAIPPELGSLSNLVSLFLSGNQLSGSLPPELGNLASLTTLYLSSSNLTGPIPPELGNLTNLTTLYLSNNQLTGPIPPELGNLSNLTSIYLHSNQLTGSIPPELGNLTNLATLYLHGNQLTGSIPAQLGNLANLTALQLSGNQLLGDIPDLTALPLTTLRIGTNAFVFADFEAEFLAYDDGAPATFSFSPQAMVDTARAEGFPSGASVLLPSAVAVNPSGNDQYQWYKDGAPIAGPYGTSRDLDITLGSGSATPADAGDYHYTISNSIVTGLTLTSEVITLTVSATCGDGFLNDPSEVCDDGNLNTGDGCNAACLLEVGEPCTDDTDCASNLCNVAAVPPVCAPPVGCGNGLLEAGEACDDGNTMNGDGCTDACEVEDGNPCTTDGECASGVCDMNEAPPVCEPAGSCGNGAVDATESCDDGNLMTGDECSSMCLLEDGAPCTDDAQCESTTCDTVGSNTCEPLNRCGNGAVETGEACDDGNAASGDGCSSICLLEDGVPCTDHAQCESTICDTVGSNRCEPANTCGNGTLETDEACDDGNASAGDSCDPQCLFELGVGPCTDGAQCGSGVCNTMAAAPVCAVPVGCGNGVLNDTEVCDDGNQFDGDGCSQSCTLKNEWRGGGGCTVSRGSENGGPLPWILGLLMLLAGRRRYRKLWPHARGLALLLAVGVCLSAGVAHAQVDCAATGTTGVPQIECEALMALYASADGANWTNSSNWDTASAVDTWFGVAVTGGQVTELLLGTNRLTGTIPSEIGDLSNLSTLHLSNSQLTVPIPAGLPSCPTTTFKAADTAVGYFDSGTSVAVPVPAGVTAGDLLIAQIGYNAAGTITPPAGWNLIDVTTNPSKLIMQGLYWRAASASEPTHYGFGLTSDKTDTAVGAIAAYRGIDVADPIDAVGARTDSDLTDVVVPSITTSTANTTLISFFSVRDDGTVTPPPGTTEQWDVNSAAGVGAIGETLLAAADEVFTSTGDTGIRVASAQNSDGSVGHLVALRPAQEGFVDPVANQLSGPIPAEIGNLANLTTLYLSGNQLTSPIPPELGNLANLTTACLHSNQLTGPIPPEIDNLFSLDTLYLHDNQLTGDIPDLTALPLTTLRFGSNAFVFADFDPEFVAYSDGAPASFQYSPQAMVDNARTASFPGGASAVLASAIAMNPSGNDRYQWYKDGAPIAGPEGTARVLDVTLGSGSVSAAEAGDYHYAISNTVVTGLILTSQVITVTVSTTCGDGVLDDDELCDDGNLDGGDGCSQSCTLKNEWRGGGGCAVSSERNNSGHGWLIGLFAAALLRRRNAAAR